MTTFDYTAPAEMFCGDMRRRKRMMAYKRFATGAEAVQHVMERLAPESRSGAVIESDQGRFDAAAIRLLYEGAEYPLRRGAPLS